MPTLLYNCPSGISGDMNLGAMVALGVDPIELETELKKLPYDGWSLHFEKDIRNGITGLRCDVLLKKLTKKKHTHPDGHSNHQHTHGSEHSHHKHDHEHHHRTFSEIRESIEGSELSNRVKRDAIQCFRILAEAEGAVHGIAVEKVHFHEVGAIDSIIDMIGAAICWELLNIDRVVCSTLEVGGGTVQCAHGKMPVPAPATARILEGTTFTTGGTNKETTTPTGAALLVGKSTEFGAMTSGKLLKTATGIGQRKDPNLPNALFASLIEEGTSHLKSMETEHDTVIELATNIDDMTAEALAYLIEELLKAGALDAWQTPATFKKGRAGHVVHALCSAKNQATIEQIFFKHSRTLGVRHQQWNRTKLPRRIETFDTKWGLVRAKSATLPDGSEHIKFEFEDCARIAREHGLSLETVQSELTEQFKLRS